MRHVPSFPGHRTETINASPARPLKALPAKRFKSFALQPDPASFANHA
jgi:hypothetical protein